MKVLILRFILGKHRSTSVHWQKSTHFSCILKMQSSEGVAWGGRADIQPCPSNPGWWWLSVHSCFHVEGSVHSFEAALLLQRSSPQDMTMLLLLVTDNFTVFVRDCSLFWWSYFLWMIYLHTCLCIKCAWRVSEEGVRIPKNWSHMVVNLQVGAGNRTRVQWGATSALNCCTTSNLQTVNKRASEQETPLTMHSFFLHNALTSTTQNSLMVVPRRTANLKYKHRLYFRPSESQSLGDGPRKLFFPLTWIFCFLNFLFENIKCYKVKLVQKNQMSVVELAPGLLEHTALRDPEVSSQHSRRVAVNACSEGANALSWTPQALALRSTFPSDSPFVSVGHTCVSYSLCFCKYAITHLPKCTHCHLLSHYISWC